MSLQVNKFIERNKLIAIRIIQGELLKVVASDNDISIERTRQITYNILYKVDVVHAGSYREFSEKLIKESVTKIEGLK